MDTWQALITNQLLAAPFFACVTAQILKTLTYVWVYKNFSWERILGDGGMPSSHSATVMALVTASVYNYGVGSSQFAITGVFAIIVMHDAMGVRRETGIQAKVLNSMMSFFTDMGKKMPVEDRLKEFVGHTPLQVCMGAILGIIVGIIVCMLMK